MNEQKLLPHQKSLIKMLQKREERNDIQFDNETKMTSSVGIIGNQHGYNRMQTIVNLIKEDKIRWDVSQPYIKKISYNYMGFNRTQIIKTIDYTRFNCNILLCGLSLMYQWEQELKKNNITFTTICTRKEAVTTNPQLYDVIICSPTMYNCFVKRFEFKFAFKRFFMDNPLYIDIRNMRDLMAGFYWFITSFPIYLLKTYKSSSQFLNRFFPSYLSETLNVLIVQNSPTELPPFRKVSNKNYICLNPSKTGLNLLKTTKVINLLKQDKIQQVLDELQCNHTSDLISYITEEFKNEIKNTPSEDAKRSCQIYYNKFKSRFKEGKITQDTCSICQDTFTQPMIVRCCYNIFCSKCLLNWLVKKRNCPLCRTHIEDKFMLYKSTINSCIKNKTPTKKQYLYSIINQFKNEKIIVFSSIKSFISIIEHTLSFNNISYVTLNGSKTKRDKSLRMYKDKKINVLVLTNVHNFIGVNLEETKHIINYVGINNNSKCCALKCVQHMNNKHFITIHHLI